MLKYVQELDFGMIASVDKPRQNKLINLHIPSQSMLKCRSVSQLLHTQLVQIQQQSSSRKNIKKINISQFAGSIIKPCEVSHNTTQHPLPKIVNRPNDSFASQSPPKAQSKPKRIQIQKQEELHSPPNFDQWNESYIIDQGSVPQSPMKEIKRMLQESFYDKKPPLAQSQILMKNQSNEKLKLQPVIKASSNERYIRCLLAEHVINDRISLKEFIPEDYKAVNNIEDMITQVVLNFQMLRQIYRHDRTITKILLKTPGNSKKIVHTFFKEIKANCPNDISQFPLYFKLRKQINQELIIAKFIMGIEPENDFIIRKIMMKCTDIFSSLPPRSLQEDAMQNKLREMQPNELMRYAFATLKFDLDYFNKLNYYNNNLQQSIRQKQVKAIQQKLVDQNLLDSQTQIQMDFDQPESLVSKLSDVERRLGRFSKITNQERFRYMEADAYMYYK